MGLLDTTTVVVDSIGRASFKAQMIGKDLAEACATNEYDMISIAVICGVVLCAILAICITTYEIISYNKRETIKKILPDLIKNDDETQKSLLVMIDKQRKVKESIQKLIVETIMEQVKDESLKKENEDNKS